MAIENQAGNVAKTEGRQIHSGNLVRILFGGLEVGLMQSVSFSEEYGTEPVYAIGDADAVEYVPGNSKYSCRAEWILLRSKALTKVGIILENSTEILKGLLFTIEVFEKAGDPTTMRKYTGVSMASTEFTITKGQALSRNATFNILSAQGNNV